MITNGPKTGTLLTVISPSLVTATLNSIDKTEDNIRWYVFDNISFLEKDTTLLYLGDETLMVTHWDFYDKEEYRSEEYYKKYLAAVFLYNDKKIYLFYDNHYDIWDPNVYLKLLK